MFVMSIHCAIPTHSVNLASSVFIVSLLRFMFFKFFCFFFFVSYKSIHIRTISSHYTLMVLHCDIMADQVTKLHIRLPFHSNLEDYLINSYYKRTCCNTFE